MSQSVVESVSQSSGQLVSQLVSESVNESVSGWISQSVKWSVSKSVSQWISYWVSQWISESVSQWVNESVSVLESQSVNRLVSQWVSKLVNESVSELESEWVSEWVREAAQLYPLEFLRESASWLIITLWEKKLYGLRDRLLIYIWRFRAINWWAVLFFTSGQGLVKSNENYSLIWWNNMSMKILTNNYCWIFIIKSSRTANTSKPWYSFWRCKPWWST